MACDRGMARLCSRTIVLLNVQDFNDEVPNFDQTEYTTDVCQDQAVSGLQLIRAVAIDRDSGTNALLTYSIVAPNLFSVVPETGLITLAADTSMTDIGSHDLTLQASDNGQTRLTGSTSVLIRIRNCSISHAPLYFLQPYHFFSIREASNIFSNGNLNQLLPISRTASDVTFAPDISVNPFSNNLNASPFYTYLTVLISHVYFL